MSSASGTPSDSMRGTMPVVIDWAASSVSRSSRAASICWPSATHPDRTRGRHSGGADRTRRHPSPMTLSIGGGASNRTKLPALGCPTSADSRGLHGVPVMSEPWTLARMEAPGQSAEDPTPALNLVSSLAHAKPSVPARSRRGAIEVAPSVSPSVSRVAAPASSTSRAAISGACAWALERSASRSRPTSSILADRGARRRPTGSGGRPPARLARRSAFSRSLKDSVSWIRGAGPVACALLCRKELHAVLAPVLPGPPSPRSRRSSSR
jgi:hypothetical protein